MPYLSSRPVWLPCDCHACGVVFLARPNDSLFCSVSCTLFARQQRGKGLPVYRQLSPADPLIQRPER